MFSKLIEKLNNSKYSKYFFVTPLVYAIGDACEQIVITSLKIKNKKIIILFPFFFKKLLNYQICNKYLFENLIINNSNNSVKSLRFFLNMLINLEFIIKRSYFILFSKLLKFKKEKIFEFPSIGIHQIYKRDLIKKNFDNINEINISKCNISLSEEKKTTCRAILYKENIFGKKIVCLHVRDGGYKKDHERKSYRNSNILNYTELINYLIKKNYFVIRMGDKSSIKYNFSNNFFLDYAHSNINSRLMDIFLISECKFFVGTQSGILDLAYMFNKPVLTTNMCEMYCSYPRKINDRGVFKKIKIKKTGQSLSLKDYIKMDYSKHNPEIEQKDFFYVENTPKELYESIVEFENLYCSAKFSLSHSQNEINKLIKDTFRDKYYSNLLKTDKIFDKMENGKIALWIKSFKGSLCESNLKESAK